MATHVSVTSIYEVLTIMVQRKRLRLIDYSPEWADGGSTFSNMFKPEVAQGVDADEGELVCSIDTHGRFMLIGRFCDELHVIYQRFTATPGRHNTTLVYQASGQPNALSELLELTQCGSANFDQLLDYIRSFTNGNAIANSLRSRLTPRIDLTQPSNTAVANDAAAADTTSVASTSVNQAEQEIPMSTENNTATPTADTAAAAPTQVPATPVVAAPKYSNWKKAGFFTGGLVLGAAISEGVRYGIARWG